MILKMILLVLIIKGILMVQGVIMVHQLMIDKIEVPFGSESFIDTNITVKRTSGRTMIADGFYSIKQQITDNIACEMAVHQYKAGVWTRTFFHRFDSFCRQFIMPGGTFYNLKTKHFKALPDKCPVKVGSHHMEQIVFSRYREDWDTGLKSVIPPVMPDAENFRLEVTFYGLRNRKIGVIRGEGRFLDKNADVGVCECQKEL